MAQFDAYKDAFPNARLTRSTAGVLEITLHSNGDTLVFDGYTHEQFVDLFNAVGRDSANRVVILTGTGDAVMEEIAPGGFDFFTPTGYDKILREAGVTAEQIQAAVRIAALVHAVAATMDGVTATETAQQRAA